MLLTCGALGRRLLPLLGCCSAALLSTAAGGESPLNRILKLDMVAPLPAVEVRKLWLLHHRCKPSTLSAVMSPVTYDKLSSRGKESPFFVLPLPELSFVCYFSSFLTKTQLTVHLNF